MKIKYDTSEPSSLFPALIESVYEEDRAIEMLLQANEAGNHERVNELAQHIRHLQQTSPSSLDYTSLESAD